MLVIFLAYFDQFRVIVGMISACFLFCRNAVPRRERFALRTAGCGAVCMAAGFAYVPLEPVIARLPVLTYGAASAGYWLFITALIGAMLRCCYELSSGETMLRLLLGCTLESIPTTFIRYLVVMMWLPDLPERRPVSYILLVVMVYALLYWCAYRVLARPLQQVGGVTAAGAWSMWNYEFLLLAFLLIMYSTNGICEWVVPTIDGQGMAGQRDLVRYFCVGIRFLVSTAFIVNQYFVHQSEAFRRERDLTNQLLKEKSEQYTFTKENIEFIQRKCHDLKRQLRALELAGEDERRTVLEETRRAAEFYDATVRTGHEVIDTLLTEKNLLCVNRGIRLSCAVSVRDVGRIGAVDLYTMLSNALDNAIEGVEQVEEPGKKTIRFSMLEQGQMLCVEVENYYSGTIRMQDGLPLTSKADVANHGIGVKSIQTLARRYDGDIAVTLEDQTFLLQIAIPLPD